MDNKTSIKQKNCDSKNHAREMDFEFKVPEILKR